MTKQEPYSISNLGEALVNILCVLEDIRKELRLLRGRGND